MEKITLGSAKAGIENACYWLEREPASRHLSLNGEISADVAIIGGGIVGVIAARLLADAGRSVALVEAGRIGQGVTGRSTAKVTAQHALKLHQIEEKHGADRSRAYADSNKAGVAMIAELVERHRLDCDFERADSFVYATSDEGVERIEQECAAARRAGLEMEIVAEAGLPFAIKQALRLRDQAQFHPSAFVSTLAATLPASGVKLFEHSPVTEWQDGFIETANGAVRAGATIMATHLPLGTVGQYYACTYPHMHAVMAVPVEHGRAPPGMYISADEPTRSLRRHSRGAENTVLILTGPRYTHGDADGEQAAFEKLEEFARAHFGWRGGGWRWTNEDYAARDGLPYVGWEGAAGKSLLVATGFDAWGLSNGAVAARILADLVEGRDNRWSACFDASRHSLTGLGTLAANAAKTTGGLVRGHLQSHSGASLPDRPGEAALVEVDGKVAGVFRDDGERLHAVSAVCTHMGCMVGFNPVDRTWDCPCHGSRFGLDGKVLHGPATEPLPQVQLEEG